MDRQLEGLIERKGSTATLCAVAMQGRHRDLKISIGDVMRLNRSPLPATAVGGFNHWRGSLQFYLVCPPIGHLSGVSARNQLSKDFE